MRPTHEILDWAIGVLDKVLRLDEPAIRDAARFRDALEFLDADVAKLDVRAVAEETDMSLGAPHAGVLL